MPTKERNRSLIEEALRSSADNSVETPAVRNRNLMVELRGFEPLAFSLRTRRATNCATAPEARETITSAPAPAEKRGRAGRTAGPSPTSGEWTAYQPQCRTQGQRWLCSSIPARVVILGPTLRVRRRGRRAGPSSAPRRSARSRRAGPRTSRRAVPRRAPSPRRPRRCRGHRGRDTPWRPR